MKKRIGLVIALLVIANITNLYAQGELPCGGDDPDASNCPLDTWVFVMAAIALLVTTLHLYKKQKVRVTE